MTATSGPGFSLMQEGIGFAIMAEIPCVIVDIQRGGPSTGLPTSVAQGDVMQARWGTHGEHSIVALTASNHQDVFAVTVEAFNIAETYRTPVVLLFDEVVGHMREKLVVPEPGEIALVERLRTSVPEGTDYHPYFPREDGRLPMSDFGGVHRYNVTGLVHDMWGFPTTNPRTSHDLIQHLVSKIESHSAAVARVRSFFLEDAETVLVSYGAAARSAMHVVKSRRGRGESVGMVELQTLWPFPAAQVRRLCGEARTVLVVEMNMGQVMAQVRAAVAHPERVFLANRYDGQMITPEDIRGILRLIQGRGV
jgi:2-oxoglutarate ferredoxin oxidoreductase subunit alpha